MALYVRVANRRHAENQQVDVILATKLTEIVGLGFTRGGLLAFGQSKSYFCKHIDVVLPKSLEKPSRNPKN